MEKRIEVRIRSKEGAPESIVWTGLSIEKAMNYISFSITNSDPNNMPEYVIRVFIQ